MSKRLILVFLISSVLHLLSNQIIYSQNQIPVSVISSGGEKISNADYKLCGTLGETFIGKSMNVSYQKYAGFWYVYEQTTITAVEDEETIPTSFELEQNYPNPFNPSTVIKFGLPVRSNVLIKIYDILGGEVVTFVNDEMEAGWYKKEFNASGYSSGIYFYRIQAGSYISTKKMILIK